MVKRKIRRKSKSDQKYNDEPLQNIIHSQSPSSLRSNKPEPEKRLLFRKECFDYSASICIVLFGLSIPSLVALLIYYISWNIPVILLTVFCHTLTNLLLLFSSEKIYYMVSKRTEHNEEHEHVDNESSE